MKTFAILPTILFISFLSPPSWSETLNMDDLVERNGLHYKKFTDIPFNGAVTGIEIGKFKNGKRDGFWEEYRSDGSLKKQMNYKDGNEHGFSKGYHENGQLEFKMNYRDGKAEGPYDLVNNGQLQIKASFKNDELNGSLWNIIGMVGYMLNIITKMV